MSVLDIFAKKDIIVTDVTRMDAGRVCIACLQGQQQMRLHAPQPTQDWLDSVGGLNPGDIVSVQWRQARRYRPPHSEDGDWLPPRFSKTGSLDPPKLYDALNQQAQTSVRSLFGKPAFRARRGNPAFRPDRGRRSLATLRASGIRVYVHEKVIRADFRDDSDEWSMVPVEDLRLWRHRRGCQDCQRTFERRLASEMSGDEGLLRVGLGRPFQPDGREAGCYLQVNLVLLPGRGQDHFQGASQ